MAVSEGTQPGLEYLQYSNATRWIILVAVILGTLMQVVDTSIVNVAIPTMMGNLGVTITEISWGSTGYIISNVIMLPLTGWLSYRFGRRRYLATSMIVFTVASFFCGTARSLGMLVFFRILQGAGGAALLSTAMATIMEIFPPYQLGMVQSAFSGCLMVGPSIGPTLGGWITDTYNWPWIFFINLPIGIAATVLTLLFMHDSKVARESRTTRVDAIGIGLLAVGLGCLQTMLEEGETDNWFDSPFICWLAVLSAIGLLAFVLWELHTDDPAVNLRILRYKEFAGGTVFAFTLGLGLYGSIFILPLFLQNLRGLTAEQCGIALLPGALSTMLVLPLVGKLVSYVSARTLVMLGTLGFILSCWMMRDLTMLTGAAQIFWPLVLRGASMAFITTPLTLSTLITLRGREIGEGSGLFNLSRQLGGSVGIALLATFIDRQTMAHRAVLVAHVTLYNPLAQYRIQLMQQYFQLHGAAAHEANLRSLTLLDLILQGQAAVMSYADAFVLIAFLFLASMPFLLLFKGGLVTPRQKAGAAAE